MQRAIPMISYVDVGEAADWLCRVFGFAEHGDRFTEPDGRVTHTELELGGATVMLGWPGPQYQGPARHAGVCKDARRWLDSPNVVDGTLVYVNDVDAHHAHAVATGAAIIRVPEDQPYGRLYVAADPEGHRWMFMEMPTPQR